MSRHEVRWDTLNSYPTSRLARIRKLSMHLLANLESSYIRKDRRSLIVNEMMWDWIRQCISHEGFLSLCDSYSLEPREFYFNRFYLFISIPNLTLGLFRSPRNFDAVLGLYRTGKLHLAAGVRSSIIIAVFSIINTVDTQPLPSFVRGSYFMYLVEY